MEEALDDLEPDSTVSTNNSFFVSVAVAGAVPVPVWIAGSIIEEVEAAAFNSDSSLGCPAIRLLVKRGLCRVLSCGRSSFIILLPTVAPLETI